MKKKIVFLSGAGMSQESGIPTFRDSDGLWENHSIEDIATPQGFERNPTLVLEFYNARRRHAKSVKPNWGHDQIAALEKKYEVVVITQNVDSLHEIAGSTKVIHLHGELNKMRSVKNDSVNFDCYEDINLGDLAPDGGQLRPDIVWFGEEVPKMEMAVQEVAEADIFVVIGTSLQVYPAASLVQFVYSSVPKYIIDPKKPSGISNSSFVFIEKIASEGMEELIRLLQND